MGKTINYKTYYAQGEQSDSGCQIYEDKKTSTIYKRKYAMIFIFIFIIIFVVVTAILRYTMQMSKSSENYSPKKAAFKGDCGVSISAKIKSDKLTISIFNKSDKDISAIQFFAIPYDKYGKEINGWTYENKFYSDSSISAGGLSSVTYSLKDINFEKIKLYIYSIYFSDGTQWGDKYADRSTILNNGKLFEISAVHKI